MKIIEYTNNGIYCVPGNFYIDPWQPVDYALITHGHGDHARWGMKHYLCHHFTKPILYERLGKDISVNSISYNESIIINGVKVSFHPAGHIIGAAQIRMEYDGYITVVSGDYKIQDDGLSTPIEIVKCHEFVSESTFGLPIYNWLPVVEMNAMMQGWVLQNQARGLTSVFIGYSLGKAQRIMKALNDMGSLFVHSSIGRINNAFLSCNINLPRYETINLFEDIKKTNGQIVILPPALLDTNVIKKIPNSVIAICSGWMQVRGSRRWQSADAGFAISDHADWQGLLSVIKATGAEKVHITHGQTAIFTRYLNEIGISANELHTQFGDEEEEVIALNEENPA